MARLFGCRPDPTRKLAGAARRHLTPGEHVLAGVYVQRPGTRIAELSGGVSGAVGATTGLPPHVTDDDDGGSWLRATSSMGIAPAVARRVTFLALLLTEVRVILLRRSRATRRVRDVVVAWPVPEIDRIEVPRNGGSVTVYRGRLALRLELPLAHKFLPDVYRELPGRFAEVREALARPGST